MARLKRTRAAQLFKRWVWNPYRRLRQPLLSVVVPFYDSRDQLATTLEGLLAQSAQNLQIILVDDGSTDGSREVADQYAATHRHVRVFEQAHAGVGRARNRGVAEATGDYLAFCDSDDLVVPSGYERMVSALKASGSDIAVGSVATQERGRFQVPKWANRSNPARRIGVPLDEAPYLLGNLMVGSRVFRRSFWDRQQLAFADDERGDALLLVSSLLHASAIDILPSVVYRWAWRADNRSLLQQDLRDKRRVAQRVRAVREPGQLLVEQGSERLQQVYFAEVLHTVVADLVRAAVCRHDGYWDALVSELGALIATMSDETFDFAPVEDRVVAWLCARGERPATEEFLEYAFDNRHGYPYRLIDGRPHIALPFIDALNGAPADLTRVADNDMRFRTRLVRLGWTGDGVLRLAGGAFAEYLDARSGSSQTTVLLTERSTGEEVRVPTSPDASVGVNQWAGRANEDHTGAGWEVEIDLGSLPVTASGGAHYAVDLELSQGGFSFRGPIGSRNVSASPGLLEPTTRDGVRYLPTWRDHRGLGLLFRRSVPWRGVSSRSPEVTVHSLDPVPGGLRLEGTTTTTSRVELALVGPRAQSRWTSVSDSGDGFSVDIEVMTDEWGLGATSLPANTYRVLARGFDDCDQPVRSDPVLWRSLPRPVDSQHWTFVPQVDRDGFLSVRVIPVEWQDSRPALLRRRLRDETYVAARSEPLLDTVLFETFAGKGTGDNPGAICAEFDRRDLGLDLVFSVIDRSNVVPPGARAVVRWSPEWFELLAGARYLVVNASLPYFFRKREGQLYYQTWHGTPLKRIAHDRPHLDFFNWHHRRQLLVARSGWDYLLSQSQFCSQALSSAFRYDGPVMEVGYPRNDVLVAGSRDEVRRRVRTHFGLDDDTLAVLYAPTWRDNARKGAVFNKVLYLDPREVVDTIENCVVLVRGHYNSVGAAEERQGSDRIVDVTRYPDIGDLYLAADVLVTDYSSVFFDFSLTDKPMIFLAPDLEEYRDENRGFYLDYHEVVPGPICLDTSEVVKAITAPDGFGERRVEFRERFNPLDDGHASARVVDRILEAFPMLDAPGGSAS